MINIRTIRRLENNDGITLKKGHIITFKTGYQVATEGVEVYTAEEAIMAVRAYEGNCGVWLSDGVYYIDKCHRVATKKAALELGRKCHQISIFGWSKQELVYC